MGLGLGVGVMFESWVSIRPWGHWGWGIGVWVGGGGQGGVRFVLEFEIRFGFRFAVGFGVGGEGLGLRWWSGFGFLGVWDTQSAVELTAEVFENNYIKIDQQRCVCGITEVCVESWISFQDFQRKVTPSFMSSRSRIHNFECLLLFLYCYGGS